MRVILWLLIATVAVKLAMLLAYVRRHHGLGRPWFERAAFAEQVSHSAPIGLSNAAYQPARAGRPVGRREPVRHRQLRRVLHRRAGRAGGARVPPLGARGDPAEHEPAAGGRRRAGMMEMNSRANVIVGTLLFPLLAFAFVFAGEIVSVVYTAAYVEAVPAMRVYVLGMLAMVVEIGSIVLLLRQGAVRAQGLAAAARLLGGGQPRRRAALRPGGRRRRQRARHLLRPHPHAAAHLAAHRHRRAPHAGLALAACARWACAALSAAAAWLFVAERVMAASGAFARAAIGGAVLLSTYAVLTLRTQMKLLFLTGSLVHGGAERHTITLANRLAERGHACHFAYVKADHEPARAAARRRQRRVPARQALPGLARGFPKLSHLHRADQAGRGGGGQSLRHVLRLARAARLGRARAARGHLPHHRPAGRQVVAADALLPAVLLERRPPGVRLRGAAAPLAAARRRGALQPGDLQRRRLRALAARHGAGARADPRRARPGGARLRGRHVRGVPAGEEPPAAGRGDRHAAPARHPGARAADRRRRRCARRSRRARAAWASPATC